MADFLKFINYIEDLKKVKRRGWVIRGIKDGESVAEHSFLTAFLVMICAKDFGADEEKAIKMALVHDAAESITGDIVWQKGKEDIREAKKEKEDKEEKAIREIFNNWEGGEEYISLWDEYKKRETKEAQFVKQMEVLERVIQAVRYEKEYPEADVSDFFTNAELYLKEEKIKKLYKEMIKERR